MRAEWTEGSLEFDFSEALQTCQPDLDPEPMTGVAPPLKSMDFYVWLPNLIWLIEVKDPEGAAHEDSTRAVWSKLKNDSLLKEQILPKIFGAYAHFVFEEADISGPVRYSILIGLSDLTAADRHMLTSKINRVISTIGPTFQGQFWPHAEVHNVESWNKTHVGFQVKRRHYPPPETP